MSVRQIRTGAEWPVLSRELSCCSTQKGGRERERERAKKIQIVEQCLFAFDALLREEEEEEENVAEGGVGL